MSRMLEAAATSRNVPQPLASSFARGAKAGGSVAFCSLASPSCSFAKPKVKTLNFLSLSRTLAGARQQFLLKSAPKRLWTFCVRAEAGGSDVAGAGVGAGAGADDSGSVGDKAIAPLRPDSPAGQFLLQTLKENPHLFLAAAEQQLDQLSAERNSQEQPNASSSDHVLYKRIAQLKAEERRRAVQEVIYALVVRRFLKAGIKMVPKISALLNKDGGASWSVQEKELEAVHSPEAFEMIKEHMEMVLGGQATLSRVEPQTVAQISKLRVGQIYATSVMYGYFLKRVDERYQLEKKMRILTTVSDTGHGITQVLSIEKRKSEVQEAGATDLPAEMMGSNRPGSAQVALKPNNLRAYVAGFDHETLSRYATMRTHETVDLIERHAEALFGRPDLRVAPDGTIGLARDDAIHIKFASLRALVSEAAAFGSYLWEVESYVDTHYNLVPRRQ